MEKERDMQQAIIQEQEMYEWECLQSLWASIVLCAMVGNVKDEYLFYQIAKPYLRGVAA